MVDALQITAASKPIAVAINWLVPFILGALWHVATYDWNKSSGHGFEVGTHGFILGFVIFGAVAGANSLGYAVALGVAPPISSKNSADLYVFSTVVGILGPAAIVGALAVFSKFSDVNPDVKRWADENTPTWVLVVGILAVLSFNFTVMKLAFLVRWLLPTG